MKNSIVLIDGKSAYTTTLIIAKGCKIEHRSVIRLLQKHSNTEILSAFEIHKMSSGGRPVEYAKLDELQTTFLITLMKNSVPVVRFKEKLSKEFFRMRNILSNIAAQRINENWIHTRKDGKVIHLQKTDIIKVFIEYAIKQGANKKGAGMYYSNIAKMENKALFVFEQKYKNMREVLTIKQLMQISTADDVIEKALQDGMNKKLNYQDCYKLAKERIIAFVAIIGRSPVLSLEITKDESKQIEN